MEPSDDPRKRKREEEEAEHLSIKASEDEPKKSKTGPLSWMVPKPAQPSADGEEISLYANFFNVEWRPETIYVFHMHIEPAAGVGVHVKRTLLSAHKEALGRYEFWGELLFAKKDLGGNTYKAQINGTEYTLTLSERIPAGRLNFIDSDRMVMFSRLLKTVFARLRYVRIRDSVYDVSAPIRYQDMEAFPGYSTNVNLFQGGLMLNIDTSFKWVQTRTVLDMLSDAGSDKARQAAVVANQIVLTRYSDRRGDRRFYRVSCLDFDKTPASTFPRRRKKEHKYAEAEEEMISFRDYFKEAHNLDIQNMRQPLLKVIEKRRRPTDGVQVEETIYLVPEFCVLAGMTESFRTNGQLRRGAMEATGMAASKKMESVRSLIGKLQPGRIVEDRKTREKIEPGRLLAEWGLYINERPMSLKGRKIATQPLVIGSEKEYRISADTAEWRDLFGAPPTKRNAPPRAPSTGLFKPVAITNWALFHLRNHVDSVNSMLQAYDTVLPELKLNLGPPVKIVVNNENHYADEMRRVWEDSKKSGRPIALFVVILPSSNATVYGKIKAVMATTPVLTQCVQVRTIKATSGLESKCKGILQQMVCKLGGSPWTIDMGPFRLRPTMIVGIDVSHSKTAIRGSVLAMTATIDHTFTRYFSDVIVQGQGQEMGSGIAACFDKALLAFRDHNKGHLPQRIIVYRDDPGGQGALEALKETEIDMMRRKLQERGIRASLAFIVVRKRGIVRLFNSDMGNPPPGTLVDTGVVSKDYNDFYLIAHTSRRGAVKPTQYQIVYRELLPDTPDDALNTPNIQKLSYMLCHLYFNFMGTIAEPAPLRYADRLANMVRQTLGGSIPRVELSNALYYL